MRIEVLTRVRRVLAVMGLVGLAGLSALASPLVSAAQEPVPDTLPATSSLSPPPASAWLVLYGDTIALFRVEVAGIPPARRAAIARERLTALPPERMLQPARIEPLDRGHMVLVGDILAFMFMDGDAAPGIVPHGTSAADVAAQRLHLALRTRAEMLAPSRRLASVAWALGATVLLIVILRVLRWLQRRELAWIDAMTRSPKVNLKLGEIDFLQHFTWLVTWFARALTQLATIVFVGVWAIYVLNRFPETREVGLLARSTVFGVLWKLQEGALSAIPGIVAIALIVFGSRFLSRIAGDLFSGIERGSIQLPGTHPETARATRRLVDGAIWLFAIVVAYPLLPGSGSDAFKGVSVFLGLMVTLGSSGVMGHMMSGLVIVYSRALKAGDVVRVNEIEGMVTEVGALSVKVINSRKEEYTIPNAVIVGTTVKNYSRLSREVGPLLTTAVTIGYDAPWRVVYEMLLGAAERTAGVLKQPAPVVFQPELADFYVVYQLTVRLEPGGDRLRILTELHQNIQDAFNERGVQIMSPHYEGQPSDRVWVPKSQWRSAPEDSAPGSR